jgi:hypothetical protein
MYVVSPCVHMNDHSVQNRVIVSFSEIMAAVLD